MKIFASASEASSSEPSIKGQVVAIGNFDGVHRGHLALLDEAKSLAAENQCAYGVLSFWPHPTRVLAPERAPKLIYSRDQKRQVLKTQGVDFLVEQPFNAGFASTPPDDFIQGILINDLDLCGVVVGHDFSFGAKGAGSSATLKQRFGKRCRVVEALLNAGQRCSSTLVRKAIEDGAMDKARSMLSRHFSMDGVVVRGDGRGKTIGFPTLNVEVAPERIHPAHGVYAVFARVGNDCFKGVANVGTRPTFADQSFRLEAHLFDTNQDLYDRSVEVFFVEYLRPEKAFKNLEELKSSIQKDARHAQEVLKNAPLS